MCLTSPSRVINSCCLRDKILALELGTYEAVANIDFSAIMVYRENGLQLYFPNSRLLANYNPIYDASYVIPSIFEGLNLRSSSTDFQVMGLILKLIAAIGSHNKIGVDASS